MTKTDKLTKMAPNGYCEYCSREVEKNGEIFTEFGWWWRKTPSGEPSGPSYPPIYIGRNFAEAKEYFEIVHGQGSVRPGSIRLYRTLDDVGRR